MSGWDFVFAGLELMTYNAKDIQLAEANIEAYPQQVYIVAKTLGWRLHDSGLAPELFPEFSDKDYVFKTQNKIVEVIIKCQQNLTKAQIQQSDLAIKYITEIPTLMQAIKAKWSLEQIQATQSKWNKISNENGNRTLNIAISIIGIFPLLSIVFIIFQVGLGIAALLSSIVPSEIGVIVVFVLIAGATTLIAGALLLGGIFFLGKKFLSAAFGTTANPELPKLREKRNEWRKNLMPAEDWEAIKNAFGGDLSSEQFNKIFKERIAFLEPLMGKEYVKTLLP